VAPGTTAFQFETVSKKEYHYNAQTIFTQETRSNMLTD